MDGKLRCRAAALAALLLLAGCAAVGTDGGADGGTAAGGGTVAVGRLALLPDAVAETSGLALIDGRLWTINDSGDDAVIYRLAEDGRSVDKQLYLAGGRNTDWESLALDEAFLYIADSGDNRGGRAQLRYYRVPRAQLSAPDGSRIDYETAYFEYGERLEVLASDDHNYDSEAVTAVGYELWLFSKNRGDGRSSLYRLDTGKEEQSVFPAASYPVDGLVTGADYESASRRLALLGYSRERLFGHSFLWLVPVPGLLPDWSGARRYRLDTYSQWEAISWDGPSRLLLTTERNPLGDAVLGEIRLDAGGEPLPARRAEDDLW